jgi:hypothetical protein
MAKAFKGRWRISEMDVWDNDYLDLVEPAHIVFESENDGAFVFGTVKAWLDVRYGARDGSACAEFSWEGLNDTDPACGRGWVILGTAGRLVGHIFIHNSDDSGFVAEREPARAAHRSGATARGPEEPAQHRPRGSRGSGCSRCG